MDKLSHMSHGGRSSGDEGLQIRTGKFRNIDIVELGETEATI